MAAQQRYQSGSNIIPEATGQAIAFIRDPKEFPINRYVQFIESPKPLGLYAQLDFDQPVRVANTADSAWEDGDPRPVGNANQASFQWEPFETHRHDFPYAIGEQALEVAQWNASAFYNSMVLSQAMTSKTNDVWTALTTASTWGGNTATATTLNKGQGTWLGASADPTSGKFLAIRNSLLAACRYINMATNAKVRPQDLRLVISPELAIVMSLTDEINAFMKNNEYGRGQVLGNVEGQNTLWGLPSHYAGLEIVIEDSPIIAANPVSAGTFATVDAGRTRIVPNNIAVILSQKGGLDGNFGAPSFSTLQVYYYKYQVAVEGWMDSKNKRAEGHVVDQYISIVAAPVAGFYITACQ